MSPRLQAGREKAISHWTHASPRGDGGLSGVPVMLSHWVTMASANQVPNGYGNMSSALFCQQGSLRLCVSKTAVCQLEKQDKAIPEVQQVMLQLFYSRKTEGAESNLWYQRRDSEHHLQHLTLQ